MNIFSLEGFFMLTTSEVRYEVVVEFSETSIHDRRSFRHFGIATTVLYCALKFRNHVSRSYARALHRLGDTQRSSGSQGSTASRVAASMWSGLIKTQPGGTIEGPIDQSVGSCCPQV